jgi:RimJ/RimL family protein N-acetyltransferase
MRYVIGTNPVNAQFVFHWMNSQIEKASPGSGWHGLTPGWHAVVHVEEDEDKNRRILAAVAFDGFIGRSAMMHIASDGSGRWFSRHFISECYRHAFETCKLTRLNAIAYHSNPAAIRLHEKLGHTKMCELTHQGGLDDHADLWGCDVDWWKTSKWNRPRETADINTSN